MVHPVVRRWLPYVNFAVAASALIFQTTVLYPWHEELDHAFKKMKDEQARQLKLYHELKVRRLDELEQLHRRVLATERFQQV